MNAPAERTCTGECGRTLPVDDEHFYTQSGGDGFAARCKECCKADTRKRKAALRASREGGPLPMKRCIGACGREIPATVENFARDPLDRPRPRCRDCELAAEMVADFARAEREAVAKREAVELPPDTAASKTCPGPCGRTLPLNIHNFHRHKNSSDGFQARCKDCINQDHRERRAAERAARPDPPPPARVAAPPLGFCDDPKVRFRMVQEFAERNPRDPTRAARAREIMANADAAVAELKAPPFDANEVLLMMAEDAEDVDALGSALRRTGWRPEGTM